MEYLSFSLITIYASQARASMPGEDERIMSSLWCSHGPLIQGIYAALDGLSRQK
jgi:hypothetical protein